MKNTLFAILNSTIFEEMDALEKKAFIIYLKDFYFKSKKLIFKINFR